MCEFHKDHKFCVSSASMNIIFIEEVTQNLYISNILTVLTADVISYLLTYLLTPWSRVLLERLTGSATSQEIPRIFGTRRFITILTSARHLSLPWANSIQSSQPPPTSWRSILILSSHLRLGLSNGLFPSGFGCNPIDPKNTSLLTAHGIQIDPNTTNLNGCNFVDPNPTAILTAHCVQIDHKATTTPAVAVIIQILTEHRA